jgi:hypothetical protein
MSEIDPHTLRTVATLVRGRMALLPKDRSLDGLERLGAHRCLDQLAKDLDISADHVGPAQGRKKR